MRYIGFILLVTLMGLPALATTVKWMSEEEMVRGAAAIIRGHVTGIETRYENKLIVRDVEIKVERWLKGTHKQSPSLTFMLLGGTLDGRTLHVPGNSEYEVGEELLIFLEYDGAQLVEMGVGAGKYKIERLGGTATVIRTLGHHSFVQTSLAGQFKTVLPQPMKPEDLSAFETRILNYLKK
tara:strand:- start:135 stop:677 length:543 start_codon:yes stop_codon:yes gene_type:complete